MYNVSFHTIFTSFNSNPTYSAFYFFVIRTGDYQIFIKIFSVNSLLNKSIFVNCNIIKSLEDSLMKDPFELNAKSIMALYELFPTEEACIKHLEAINWHGKPVSPFDKTSKVYKLKSGKYRCKNTGKNFTVRTGTMFEKTKISLRKWFIAIWLVTNHKTGLSSYQLANDIEVTQKTAWYMLHKIRHAMRLANENFLEETVEIDETLVGGRNGNRHWDKKVPHSQGRSHKDKAPVVGMIQRENLMNARVTPDTKSDTLSAFIKEYIHPDAIIYTDENDAYNQIGFTYTRFYVDHSKKLYSYEHITTNRIEGAWTHFKRMVKGTYRTLLKKYLQKYVDEFVYRYNLRDVSNSDRFNCFLCCADTRYTYKQIRKSVA